jgi:hypothetical protein
MPPATRRRRAWLVAYYVLLALFILTAALNMAKMRAGFFTNHAADVVVPAWLYIVARGRHSRGQPRTWLQRTIGRTPETAALSLFLASTATEFSQRQWPRGVFAGRFDPLDVLSYAVGLGACYALEKIWPVE